MGGVWLFRMPCDRIARRLSLAGCQRRLRLILHASLVLLVVSIVIALPGTVLLFQMVMVDDLSDHRLHPDALGH